MSWLADNLLIGTVAAGVVFALCRVLRPRPALAHVLWLLVLVELVCPPLVMWSLPAELVGASPAPAVDPAMLALLLPALAAEPQPAPFPWETLLVAVQLAGSFVVLVAMVLGFARVHALAKQAVGTPAWLEREVHALAARLGTEVPRVTVVPGIGSAFVLSTGRPRLFWPSELATDADLPRVRSVLAHELAHIRRRDHWVAWLEMLALVALWWNPLVWLARAKLRHHAELACDAWAVWAVPAGRIAYAGALIDALDRDSQAVVAVPVLGARPGARRAFEKRLHMILREDVPRRLSRWTVVPVLALSLAVVSGFTIAQDRGHRDDRSASKLERDIRAEVLRKVNQELREKLGADFEVERLGDVSRAVRRYVREKESKQRERVVKERRKSREKRARPAPQGRRTVRDEIRAGMREGIEEARREIRKDKDLRALGLTGEVEKLLDGILGQGEVDLGGFIGKAMQAGWKMARKEIRNDRDLQELGIADDVEKFIEGLLGDHEVQQGLQGLIHKAMRGGLRKARAEIENDPDLRRLGISGEVGGLIDGLLGGGKGKGDLGGSLERIIERAMQIGLRDAGGHAGRGERRVERERRRSDRDDKRRRLRRERDRERKRARDDERKKRVRIRV